MFEWWKKGKGFYPTIEDFEYTETMTFELAEKKPFFRYTQTTYIGGQRKHEETGYLKFYADNALELFVTHNTGLAEIEHGEWQRNGESLLLKLASGMETTEVSFVLLALAFCSSHSSQGDHGLIRSERNKACSHSSL